MAADARDWQCVGGDNVSVTLLPNTAYGLCMTPISGLITVPSDDEISHSYISNLHLLSGSIREKHQAIRACAHPVWNWPSLMDEKEDEKQPLWRCRPLRNTRKCNQQWPMLDSTNPGEFLNIPSPPRGNCAWNSGTSITANGLWNPGRLPAPSTDCHDLPEPAAYNQHHPHWDVFLSDVGSFHKKKTACSK